MPPLPPDEAERVLQDASRIAAANRAREPKRLDRPKIPSACISDEEIKRREEVLEQRKRRQRIEQHIERCGVPSRYEAATLDGRACIESVPHDVADAYDAAVRRLKSLWKTPTIVALIGPRGPGKTWMGCALVLDFCRADRSATYIDAIDYFQDLKDTYGGRGAMSEQRVEKSYLTQQLLVIDAMEERGDTAWEDRMLTRLVRKRHDLELATLLIANHDRDKFMDRVGPSIEDRLHDGGVIECNWGSLRGRISA